MMNKDLRNLFLFFIATLVFFFQTPLYTSESIVGCIFLSLVTLLTLYLGPSVKDLLTGYRTSVRDKFFIETYRVILRQVSAILLKVVKIRNGALFYEYASSSISFG